MLTHLFCRSLTALYRCCRPALTLMLLLCALVAPVAADEALEAEIEQLRADVAALSQTLFDLEEAVLYPADTQFAVYLSLANPEAFELDSVELSVDGRPAVSHLYTERQRQALAQGGLQRLYLGNLATGEHTLSATFNGQAANDRYMRRQASFTVRKGSGATGVQLVLEARAPDLQPVFTLREWQ